MKKLVIISLSALIAAGLAGCDRRTTGAVAGAAIGGGIGGWAGGTTGAVIGGVAGAAAGSAISKPNRRHRHRRYYEH